MLIKTPKGFGKLIFKYQLQIIDKTIYVVTIKGTQYEFFEDQITEIDFKVGDTVKVGYLKGVVLEILNDHCVIKLNHSISKYKFEQIRPVVTIKFI